MSYSAPRLHFFPVCMKYTAITVFGYLNSISVDFYDFISFYFNSLLASTEKRVLNATRSGVVLFQKLVLRVSPGFQTLENNKTTRPEASWFQMFLAFGTLVKPSHLFLK